MGEWICGYVDESMNQCILSAFRCLAGLCAVVRFGRGDSQRWPGCSICLYYDLL